MESVLHDIQELQKIAEDLAVGGVVDTVRYEADMEMFLGRIEGFVVEKCVNFDYLTTKLMEVRANMGYLLRGHGEPERYRTLAVHGLNGVYRSIRHPAVGEALNDGGE